MTEREKVVSIFDCILNRTEQSCSDADCSVDNECYGGCSKYVVMPYEACAHALALLKEQEARVMTLEELQAIETPWNRNTPPYLFVEERSGTGSRWIRWMSWGIIHDGVRSQGTMGVQNYGSKWRVWNLEPTPEQMRDTKWEEEAE